MSQSPSTAPASPEPANGPSRSCIDASCRWPLLGLYGGAAVWLVLSAVAALLASMSFHAPDMFADCAAFSYGRMAPVAQNALLYGVCIPAAWAAGLWMMSRLGGTPLVQGAMVVVGGKIWYLGVLVGVVGIAIGDSSGFEGVEFPVYAAWPLMVGALLIGISGLNTLRARREALLHPVQLFSGLGVLWFPWVYLTATIFLQATPLRGVAQGAVHWWTVANLEVVLLGAMGVAILFYFMPLFKQQGLPSRQVALFTLVTLVFCGGWVGVPATAPAPAWLSVLSQVMAVCLMLPLLGVFTSLRRLCSSPNTFEGRYLRYSLRAFVLWTGALVILNLAGAFKSLSFTLVQPALTQLFLQGFSLMASLAAAYHILPRITGRDLPFPGLARVHFWLASVGVLLVVVPLFVGGVKQASAWADVQVAVNDVAAGTLMPIRLATTGQLLLIVGHGVLLLNVVGLVMGMGRAFLKGFDNAPARVGAVTEGRA